MGAGSGKPLDQVTRRQQIDPAPEAHTAQPLTGAHPVAQSHQRRHALPAKACRHTEQQWSPPCRDADKEPLRAVHFAWFTEQQRIGILMFEVIDAAGSRTPLHCNIDRGDVDRQLNRIGMQEAMLVDFGCAKRHAIGWREERIGVIGCCAFRVAADERGQRRQRQRQWREAGADTQQDACQTDAKPHDWRGNRFKSGDSR
jgi:hypothetical protein